MYAWKTNSSFRLRPPVPKPTSIHLFINIYIYLSASTREKSYQHSVPIKHLRGPPYSLDTPGFTLVSSNYIGKIEITAAQQQQQGRAREGNWISQHVWCNPPCRMGGTQDVFQMQYCHLSYAQKIHVRIVSMCDYLTPPFFQILYFFCFKKISSIKNHNFFFFFVESFLFTFE